MKTSLTFLIFLSFLIGCSNDSEIIIETNEDSKRNENWGWVENGDYGKGQWVPVNEKHTVKNGDYTMFYFNGNISEKGRLLNQRLIDTTTFFNLQGEAIRYKINSKDTSYYYFIKNGNYEDYYRSGKKKAEGIVVNHDLSYNWTRYYKNGNIEDQLKTVGDTTYCSYFYESGEKEGLVILVNEKEEGKSQWWSILGNLEEEANWKNGLQHGIKKTFHENGQLEKEEMWENGMLINSTK